MAAWADLAGAGAGARGGSVGTGQAANAAGVKQPTAEQSGMLEEGISRDEIEAAQRPATDD